MIEILPGPMKSEESTDDELMRSTVFSLMPIFF